MNEIGLKLKNAREASGVSLEEASEDLSIKEVVLENIESGNIGSFKDIFVLKDYIKDYAKYLGISPSDMEKLFNEYLFEYTSKIPIKEIEEKMKEQKKLEETQPLKVQSPYTTSKPKYKTKSYVLIYIVVILLVALAIFWSIKQITVDSRIATVINYVK